MTPTCEAVRPHDDLYRPGFLYERCPEPAAGLRPMRSLAGGYVTGATPFGPVTWPMHACLRHLAARECFAHEPHLARRGA